MHLRFATAADCEAMRAIYAPYVLHTTASWEYDVPSAEEFAARRQEKADAGFAWLCAENESTGALLGYAYAGRYAARRGYDFSAETTVYVEQNAHGRGVGRALYGALLALLTAQGYCNAFALITQPNDRSHAFHCAQGFVRETVLANMGYKHGAWLGLGIYAKALHAPLPPSPAPTVRVEALPKAVVAAALGE